jgi:hypothetical protein
MLMRTHDGGVDRDVPVDVTGRVVRRLDLLQQPLPCPVRRPLPKTFVDGLPRPEPLRKVTPVHPGSHPVEDPVDHLPVIPPPATTAIADRQERPQSFPLRIRQVTPPHTQDNEPEVRQSHDLAGKVWPFPASSPGRAVVVRARHGYNPVRRNFRRGGALRAGVFCALHLHLFVSFKSKNGESNPSF